MRVLTSRGKPFRRFMDRLADRAGGVDPEIERSVRDIVDRVRRGGDREVRACTRRYDGVSPRSLRYGPRDFRRARETISAALRADLEHAANRIRAFHERQKEESWFYHDTLDGTGALLGQIVRPLKRIGAYVPGGTASYPSSLLMNVIPAQVAGVREIAVCVPMPKGKVNPAVLAAADLLGVHEVYRIGGAQAVAALAYGTESIPAVDKIVGPGNIYVATAKRMVFGAVDIDMVAGPSEILIIADHTADPAFVAADLLSQAEHDELASAVLLTPSTKLARSVARHVQERLQRLSRKAIARTSLERYGAATITRSLDEAVEISNVIAPEHLEIMTERPMDLVANVENAGAIFLGPWTPEPLGDYAAGPNHTLPTGRTARFSSPLGVYDFVKRSSILQFQEPGFAALADTVERLARAEGLEAHARTIDVRRRRKRR